MIKPNHNINNINNLYKNKETTDNCNIKVNCIKIEEWK